MQQWEAVEGLHDLELRCVKFYNGCGPSVSMPTDVITFELDASSRQLRITPKQSFADIYLFSISLSPICVFTILLGSDFTESRRFHQLSTTILFSIMVTSRC